MQTAVLHLSASASAMDIAVFPGRHGQFVKDRAVQFKSVQMQNRQLHFVEPEEEIKCFNGPPRAMKQVRGKLRFGYTASRGVAPYDNGQTLLAR